MGSRAHTSMLAHQGLITDGDRDRILEGRLHIAHCRNDQVCTNFNLWCRDSVDAIVLRIKYLHVCDCKCYLFTQFNAYLPIFELPMLEEIYCRMLGRLLGLRV